MYSLLFGVKRRLNSFDHLEGVRAVAPTPLPIWRAIDETHNTQARSSPSRNTRNTLTLNYIGFNPGRFINIQCWRADIYQSPLSRPRACLAPRSRVGFNYTFTSYPVIGCLGVLHKCIWILGGMFPYKDINNVSIRYKTSAGNPSVICILGNHSTNWVELGFRDEKDFRTGLCPVDLVRE